MRLRPSPGALSLVAKREPPDHMPVRGRRSKLAMSSAASATAGADSALLREQEVWISPVLAGCVPPYAARAYGGGGDLIAPRLTTPLMM